MNSPLVRHDFYQVRQTIESNHYTKSWPSGKSVPVEFNGAIVVFSIPANYNVARWLGCKKDRVWELTRLWAPDGHAPNLLTQAISFAVDYFHSFDMADALVFYADPNVGHHGGIYKAASWIALGQSEESRAYRDAQGNIVSRRAFHSGSKALRKEEILARGYTQLKLPGKLRFARGLTRIGKRAVLNKQKELAV